ncbi:MAG: hypothetical protein QOD06_1384 [Candidatus Binatota bacterium]|jgi:hypothetical protein|nr:hypothetical protein [Candidatus Binatota bacterium]
MRQNRPEGPFVDRSESDVAERSPLVSEEPRLALVCEEASFTLLGAGGDPDAEVESDEDDVAVVDEDEDDEDDDEDEDEEDEEDE